MRRRQQTIRINQGYRIDSSWEGLALAGRLVGGFVRLVWRWRTELALAAALLAVWLSLGRHLDPERANLVTAAIVAVVVWGPRRAPNQATPRPPTPAAAPAPAASMSSPSKLIPAAMAASDATTNGVAVPAKPRRSSNRAHTR